MIILKAILLFIVKAIGYGLCLAFGFWLTGYGTQNFQYYFEAYMNGHWNDCIDGKDITYKQRFMNEWFVKPFIFKGNKKVEAPVARSASEASASDNNSNNSNNPTTTDKPNTDISSNVNVNMIKE